MQIDIPKYPLLPSDTTFKDSHGLSDPFSYLANQGETLEYWIAKQNELSSQFIKENDLHPKILQRLTQLYDFPKSSTPFKVSEFYLSYQNIGLQNHDVLYIRATLNSDPKVLLDPNSFSSDGSVSMKFVNFTKSGKYFSFGVSDGGSDWTKVKIKKILDKKNNNNNCGDSTEEENSKKNENNDKLDENIADYAELEEEIKWVKYSYTSWTLEEDGFFYSGFSQPKHEFEACENMKVFFHKVGTSQSLDEVVFEYKENIKTYNYGNVSDDGKYLLITVFEGTDPEHKLYLLPMDDFRTKKFKNLIKYHDEFSSILDYITNKNEIFYFKTNYKAKKHCIISTNIKSANIFSGSFETIIPESTNILQEANCANHNFLLLKYSKDVCDILSLHDLSTGHLIQTFETPEPGSIGLSCDIDQSEFFYKFTSFLYPGSIFHYQFPSLKEDQGSVKPKLFAEIKPKDFDRSKYSTKQVFYKSLDGTSIPMFLITPKILIKDKSNPFFLYGYGGFNISLLPNFSSSRLCLLSNLGISVAIANIRGGGEFGDEWHEAGKKYNKQNTFDDFYSAAQYLITEEYTTSEKIAIYGASNGGLLIAACLNQHPESYGLAIASRGVLDMINFHKFTCGGAWVCEYGNAEKKEDFEYLIKYSPIHNIKKKGYPPFLILTSDNDDRVAPVHSYKMAAHMQNESDGFVLLQVISKTSHHGGGTPTDKALEETADIYCFMAKCLGLEYKN